LRFLLLQAWVPINSVAFGGNSPTWSLSCEVAFYVALPFLLLFLHRIGWTIKVIVSVAYFLLASSFVAVVALHGLTAPWLAVFAYANPLVRFGEFLLGVVAALAIKNGWIMKVPLAAVLIGLSVLGLALTRAYPLPDAILTPLFLAVIVLAAQRDLQRPKGLLASRWMVYAGEVSFSFYLVHQLVIENVGHLIGHGGLPVAAVDFLVSVLAAVLVHHAVEVPCQALIRGRLSAARSIAVHPEALAD
jgi:peptidoglycan/LPS O-acetylase OafA/YrhL